MVGLAPLLAGPGLLMAAALPGAGAAPQKTLAVSKTEFAGYTVTPKTRSTPFPVTVLSMVQVNSDYLGFDGPLTTTWST